GTARDADRWESNNWVVAGSRTASGKPIVANDPHRAITTPSLRYLVHLSAPGWNVIGGGEPAIPGVAIGHNAHGAWGLTIFGIDTEDLYVYELAPGNPRRYRHGGAWLPMTAEVDTVRVRGGAPVPVTLLYTRHGPVLHVDSARGVAVALRAGWLEPGGAPYLASLRLDQARTWAEARAALAYARMPALNWVWADTSGTIGWQAAGIAPRRRGWDGLTPVPGDGRFEWAGFLPIPQLPSVTNPPQGYVGTANAYNVDPRYPHHDALARSWAEPWRHDRLREVLDTTRRADVRSMAALQHDEVPLAPRQLVPLLRAVQFRDGTATAARDTLLAWNGVLGAESRGGAVYAAWERQLQSRMAARVLPGPVRGDLRTVPLSRTVAWLTTADAILGADPVAVRDSLVRVAFEGAVADLLRRFGPDLGTWRYGDPRFHHARIAHVLDPLVPDTLRTWLSHGPLPRGGYANTLNATGNGDNQTSGPSLRVVIDLADWDRAIATNTPGQSGDPRSPWYRNLFPLWAANRYVPLPYSASAVTARAAVVDTITP
ncbi:MAG: penicillin acylase family protein, partial [Gemmatimonadetes bacterium]|nr:penicillin acylase family protein [Gemmatimonadota bacterium]